MLSLSLKTRFLLLLTFHANHLLEGEALENTKTRADV
jgi:hypothetical protein